MKRITVTRRQMLRGAGGFTLGLPFLPSLIERPGLAAEAAVLPRFVAMASNHGGINESNMYPSLSMVTESMSIFPGHLGHWGKLVWNSQDGVGYLSPVLTGSLLTQRLLQKLNVIRGLDIPFYISHNTGGHLGNYARNDGNGGDGAAIQSSPMPTIDQLMAYSSNFYSNLNGIRERTIITGNVGRLCWNYSNPSARSGAIQEVRGTGDSIELFKRIFVPDTGSTPTPVAVRKPIVDRVIENYRSLSQSNRRLSALDKQRLGDHMDRLAELQRRLTAPASTVTSASCREWKTPTVNAGSIEASRNEPSARQKFALYNDVVAAAFMCGSSRIAIVGVSEENFAPATPAGDWHQAIAHMHTNPGPQQTLVAANRGVFSEAFLDLATKLDVEESGGRTYLDNSLMAWSQESSEMTHDNRSMPLILAGGACGRIKTGLYIDYRNREKPVIGYEGGRKEPAGLTWNRWLATALQVMGLPPSEWETSGVPGYGLNLVRDGYKGAYVSGVIERASEPLPVLTV